MSTILLSIKPKYVIEILKGTKKYEFRKIIPKNTISEIVIYSSYPEQKIIGIAKVKRIISDTPHNLWEKTKDFAGISKEKYLEYFSGRDIAYAFELTEIEKYNSSKTLKDYGIKQAPQSFMYTKSLS